MALQYNLAKVYEISENDTEFALQIVTLFLEEVPAEMKSIKTAIEEKPIIQLRSCRLVSAIAVKAIKTSAAHGAPNLFRTERARESSPSSAMVAAVRETPANNASIDPRHAKLTTTGATQPGSQGSTIPDSS